MRFKATFCFHLAFDGHLCSDSLFMCSCAVQAPLSRIFMLPEEDSRGWVEGLFPFLPPLGRRIIHEYKEVKVELERFSDFMPIRNP